MCGECGCAKPTENGKKTIEVATDILQGNAEKAAANRVFFHKNNILVINLMSSPGAGKTTLLEKTIEKCQNQYRLAVIEGDLETEKDAQRIKDKGIPAYQITTGQACHIDAFMVEKAWHHLPMDNLDILFIENVGNLVCPASYDLGADINVVLLSTPEGDDKPAKYPVMFQIADLVLITKNDLLDYVDFDMETAKQEMIKIRPDIEVITLSSKKENGLENWFAYLNKQKQARSNVDA